MLTETPVTHQLELARFSTLLFVTSPGATTCKPFYLQAGSMGTRSLHKGAPSIHAIGACKEPKSQAYDLLPLCRTICGCMHHSQTAGICLHMLMLPNRVWAELLPVSSELENWTDLPHKHRHDATYTFSNTSIDMMPTYTFCNTYAHLVHTHEACKPQLMFTDDHIKRTCACGCKCWLPAFKRDLHR